MDSLTNYLFESATVALASTTHLLVQSRQQTFAKLRKLTRKTWAIVGTDPLHDDAGRINLASLSNDPGVIEFWRHPANQRWLVDHGWHSRLGSFHMSLPLPVPSKLLITIISDCKKSFWGDSECFECIPRWLEQGLQVAYAPIMDETDVSAIIARTSAQLTEISETLSRGGVPFTRLEPRKRGFDFDAEALRSK